MSHSPVSAGQRFGRLTTVMPSGRAADSHVLWKCSCDCGNTVIRQSNNLKVGRTPSCGCAARDIHKKHGMRGSPTYTSWQAAKRRCVNSTDKDFRNYGGRGISMCAEWIESFEQFFEDMGERPSGTTLERMETNGNYEPGNCIWANATTQSRNKRTSVYVEWKGQRQHLCMVAADLGITYGAAFMRHKRGKLL